MLEIHERISCNALFKINSDSLPRDIYHTVSLLMEIMSYSEYKDHASINHGGFPDFRNIKELIFLSYESVTGDCSTTI